jgi:cephalosporin-C deacetylase
MPLQFDMPLEELYTYQGTNPRPGNFQEFWDEGLAEMRGLEPKLELVPASFQTSYAECFHLYFSGVGGARVHAKLLHPRGASEPGPAVLMFHGYSIDSGDWYEKLGYVANGYTVAALDCRGQGGLSEDVGGVAGTTLQGHIVRGLDGPPEQMLFRQIFLDAAQLAGIVMDMSQVVESRVGATGSSQGGGLTLACAALEPRVERAAPVFPFLCDYQRVWDLDLDKDAYEELRYYFRRFDPQHRRETAIFEKLGYIDVQHLCSRIQGEVFMGVGLRDEICPPSTQFAAYNKIVAKKSLAIYPDYGHEFLPRHSDAVYEFMTEL